MMPLQQKDTSGAQRVKAVTVGGFRLWNRHNFHTRSYPLFERSFLPKVYELPPNRIFSAEHSTTSFALESLLLGAGAKRQQACSNVMIYQLRGNVSLQTGVMSVSGIHKPAFRLCLIYEYVFRPETSQET